MTKGNNGFYIFFFSFEDGFDSSVAYVFDPACHIVLDCFCPSFVPEKYALNVSADENVSSSFQPVSPIQNLGGILNVCYELFSLVSSRDVKFR